MDPIIDLIKMKTELMTKSSGNTIAENEVIDVLGNELPKINPWFERISDSGNIYKIMDCFAAFTKALVARENMDEVKLCFQVAEKLLNKGNKTVKNAIENGYLFSISKVLDVSAPINKKVKNLLKGQLLVEYKRQTCSNGI